MLLVFLPAVMETFELCLTQNWKLNILVFPSGILLKLVNNKRNGELIL